MFMFPRRRIHRLFLQRPADFIISNFHISHEDLAHMKQILLDGFPAELMFKEPLSNKMAMVSRGNFKSLNDNPEIVKKTMNEEDRYSHIVSLDILICLLLPYLRHTTQTMVNGNQGRQEPMSLLSCINYEETN